METVKKKGIKLSQVGFGTKLCSIVGTPALHADLQGDEDLKVLKGIELVGPKTIQVRTLRAESVAHDLSQGVLVINEGTPTEMKFAVGKTEMSGEQKDGIPFTTEPREAFDVAIGRNKLALNKVMKFVNTLENMKQTLEEILEIQQTERDSIPETKKETEFYVIS